MARKCGQCMRGRAVAWIGKGAKALYVCSKCYFARHLEARELSEGDPDHDA